MSTEAVILVLAAAGLHALWNLRLHGAEDRVPVMAVSYLLSAAALSPWLVTSPPAGVVGLVVLSGAAQAAYAVGLSASYRRGQLSIAYPVARGTAPLIVTLAGIGVLGERPSPGALAGAVALGAGLGVLGVAGRRAASGVAVAFGVLTGMFIAAYSVIDARAVRSVEPVGYLAAVMLLAGVVLVPASHLDVERLRRVLPTGAVVAVGSTTAYLLILFAFRLAPAGRVATLREIAVLIAIAVARDRPGAVVWVGGAFVVAGAVLAGI